MNNLQKEFFHNRYNFHKNNFNQSIKMVLKNRRPQQKDKF